MKKLTVVLLSFVLCLGLLGSCTSPTKSDASTVSPEGGSAAELEPAVVKLYFVCDEPADLKLVEDKLNELFQRDMNTTIQIKFTTWTDYTQKYDLALKSGDDIDLIYTATWMSYAQYSTQSAFMKLDELIPQHAPKLWEMIDESVWNQVKVDGSIYAIPSTNYVYSTKGVLYRKDLCDKHGLPVPDSVENVEAYLLGIKEHEPDMSLYQVFNEQNPSGEPFPAHTLLMNFRYPMVNEEFSSYGLVADYNKPAELFDYWGSDEFVEDMKVLKRWADYGFWSRSVLSESPDPGGFNEGRFAMVSGGLNPDKASNSHKQLKASGKGESGYYMFAQQWGIAHYATPMANMTSIPHSCKQPDRALMVLEKLTCDPDYYTLLEYGIEGVHYKNVDGYYEGIREADGSGRYDPNGFAWSIENPKLAMKQLDQEYYMELKEQLDAISAKTPFGGADISGGFIENTDPYQAERAALGNVIAQYLAPLEAGMVEDVEAAVAEFIEKAKAAGIEKIHEGYREQWAAYCEEYGYK